ncbi:MAG: segregation/condensation protein A [Clostridia bacterium]|nr:segregation/condensation protein A [Clostridia bacterium]
MNMKDLLKEVEKGKKADLKDLNISQITGQYLEKIKKGKDLDLDEASSFLVSAAELLRKKTLQMLKDNVESFSEEENTDEEENAEQETSFAEKAEKQLAEYRTFKEAANFLKSRLMSEEKYYPRPEPELSAYMDSVNTKGYLEGLKLEDLLSAFEKLLIRHKGEDEEDDGEFLEIEGHEYKITEKIDEILKFLKGSPAGIEFNSLFAKRASKGEIIVTFLALLELVRLQKVRVKQEEHFGKIIIYPILAEEKIRWEHNV